MSVSTSQQYVTRQNGRLVCGRCRDYRLPYQPSNPPTTKAERIRHVLYTCPQLDAVDREYYLKKYGEKDNAEEK